MSGTSGSFPTFLSSGCNRPRRPAARSFASATLVTSLRSGFRGLFCRRSSVLFPMTRWREKFSLTSSGSKTSPFVRRSTNWGWGGVVRFRGAMDYWSTLGELASSTALVLIEAPCDEGVFLPSKLADYVQVRRPVLAVSPRQGTVRDLISQYGGGVVVDCTRPDDILAGMRENRAGMETRNLEHLPLGRNVPPVLRDNGA